MEWNFKIQILISPFLLLLLLLNILDEAEKGNITWTQLLPSEMKSKSSEDLAIAYQGSSSYRLIFSYICKFRSYNIGSRWNWNSYVLFLERICCHTDGHLIIV